MKIKAAVIRTSNGPYTIEEVDLAEPGPGQLRVRVVGVGMCHTDQLPRLLGTLPVIAGHEGSGVVDAVGEAVTSVRVGDHVVMSYDACHACRNCLMARRAYCESFFARNLTGAAVNGPGPVHDAHGDPVLSRWFGQSSFATHCVVDARNVVIVDESLPLERLGPLGCSVQTGAGSIMIALNVPAGSSVVVFGSGAVGLTAIMAAQAVGATTVIAVDKNLKRLELATEFGTTDVLLGSDPDLLDALRELTRGGADYTLDTTGAPAAITTALEALRPGGVCGLVGAQRGNLSLEPTTLAVGRTLVGILEGSAVPQTFIPRLIDLWQTDRLPFDRLITTFAFDHINEAERQANTGDVIKPVLLPTIA